MATLKTQPTPVFTPPFHNATYNNNTISAITHTTQPIVTGTSVLGIKYEDGIMLIADTLGSYGSMAMFKNIERVRKINDNTVVAAGGEYSDLQEIAKQLYILTTEDNLHADQHELSVDDIYSYLHRWLYSRRSKIDPLWNSVVIAGYNKFNKTYTLGHIDLYGTHYTDNIVGTGYGAYLGLPLLRKKYKDNMSAAEARVLLEDTMKVLLYRDCRTLNSIQIANITSKGVEITEPYKLDTKWEYKRFVDPYTQA